MDDCSNLSRLFLPLHVQADMFGGLLTKLAQTPSIRIDVGQAPPLGGIHELRVQREGVGFNSSLVGVMDVPLDRAPHFSREDTMVSTSVNLYAARDWLAHEALVPRDSYCCKRKEVVVLPAECPEGRRPKHLFPSFRQRRERSGCDPSIMTAQGLRLPTQQPGSAMGAEMGSSKANGAGAGARVHS